MKRFIKLSGMLFFGLLLFSQALVAQSMFTISQSTHDFLEIEFYLDNYELVTTEVEGIDYQRVTHPEASLMMNEGLPELPVFSTSIAIPNRGSVRIKEVSVIEVETINNIMVYPSQGFDLEISEVTGFIKDEAFYLKDQQYPGFINEISTPAIMRDFRFVSITITPFRYNPLRAELEVNRHLRLKIEYDYNQIGENEITGPPRRLSRSFDNIYRNLFLNYEEFRDPSWEYQARSILVIYHHNAIIEPIVNNFVNWKRDKGFEITATNTQTMSTNIAIKNYIQNAYNTWENPPEYVILIGGGTGSFTIPPFYAYPNYAGDHPYSLLEGNDDISDVFIGRLPIADATQLQTIWNKIRNYEREPFIGNMDWYQHALLVGSPTGWGISTLYTPKYVKELMLLYNPNFTFSEVYYSPFPTQMNAALNQGTFVLNYRGYYGFSGWSPTDPNINNGLMMPYCFFLTCNTLTYSNNSETERMVTIGTPTTPKGGIGAIGLNTLESKTAYNNALSGSYTYGIYNEGIRTLGETLVRGKIFLHQTFGIVHPSHPPQFSHWANLMGDPSMDIWVDTPQVMNVAYDSILPLGNNFIDIVVTDQNGDPLKDAWVTIRQGADVIFATGYTDQNGMITHFFPADSTGEINLTVTKPDYIPHLGSFQLTGTPVVSLYSVLVNDPINAGETLNFITNVKNYRDDSVYGVNGTITTNSPYINILEGSTSYGNISAGNIAEATDEYSISISHAAPDLIPVIFTLTLTDSVGATWISKFTFRINGNSLKPVSLLVGDSNDYINPGQTSQMRMVLQNQGQLNVSEVYGILRTNNPLLDISDSVAYFGNIAVGESVISSPTNSFIITAFESLITGMTVPLEIYLYNHLGYEALATITLPIGLVTVTDPLGPCDYGYYIYGMEDTNYEYSPTYEWIEIAPQLGGPGINTGLQSDFNNLQPIFYMDLPFTFRFYGKGYDTVTISANGWISFGVTEQGTYRNWILPGPMGPNSIIAAFWDNLSLAQGGVYTWYDQENERFIVQWHNARNLIGSAEETFQIILWNANDEPTIDDGFIKIQYKAFNNVNNSTGYPSGNWGNYCTVGIGDHTGNRGLTYTFANQYPTAAAPLTHNKAILIVGPENFGEPFLVRQNVVVFDEGGSGYIDAGENIKLGIYIRNIGYAAATNVNGTISTDSPYIFMLADSSPYYDIVSAADEVNRQFYEFNVSASTQNGHTANFMIHLTADNIDISFPFHLTVSRPSLQLSSYMIEEISGNGDGIIDPGETINLVLNFSNSTMTAVMNTQLNVSSSNQYLTINTPQAVLGDIPSQSNLQKPISITISENCPVQEIINLSLNINGDNIIGFNKEILLGVSLEDIFIDFESDDGEFISNYDNGWQWGVPAAGSYSGDKAWATVLDGNYADSANWTLDTPQFLITPASILSFYHKYNIEQYWDGGNVKISTDNGTTWQIIHPQGGYPLEATNSGNMGIPNQPAYSGNSNGWQQTDFLMGQYFGQLARFRYHFGSGPWVNAPGWFIDDFHLHGTNPLYGSISGQIELIQSPVSSSQAIIKAGDYSTRPDNNGNYSLILPAGNYNVSVHLPYHYSVTTYEITVDELESISDLDFSLQYLTPPENLRYTLNEDDNTVELSWNYNPLPPHASLTDRLGRSYRNADEQHVNERSTIIFSIYRQKDSGIFNLINTTSDESFIDTLPVNQSIYRYYVVVEYTQGESNKSNIVSTDDPYYTTDEQPLLPDHFFLAQNYPNPFNPITNISFSIPTQERVSLKIYNIRGELVKTLIEDLLPAGNHNIQWHGLNNNNRPVSSGIYFYQIQAGSYRESRKALLLK